jgi:hypothetical protein
MIDNTITLSSLEVAIIHGAFLGLFVALIYFWVRYANEKQKRLSEQNIRGRRIVQLERCIEFFKERDRLEEVVRRQRAEASAVTLPVTHCERRERRRRFLPLEQDNNAAR